MTELKIINIYKILQQKIKVAESFNNEVAVATLNMALASIEVARLELLGRISCNCKTMKKLGASICRNCMIINEVLGEKE